MNDSKSKKKLKDNHSIGGKSKEKFKLTCFRCERPGHVQANRLLKKIRPDNAEVGAKLPIGVALIARPL